MKKKSIIISSIFISILLAAIVSISIYILKVGKTPTHQAKEGEEEFNEEIKTESGRDTQQETELESLLPETADAVSEKGNNSCFTYEELPDGTLRITDYNEEKNTQNPYQVVIPSTIDGKQVSILGKGCMSTSYAGSLLELTIFDGITTIEENVIESAYDISLVRLPDSVTFIDEKAFWIRAGWRAGKDP